jgi:hypothetical protein
VLIKFQHLVLYLIKFLLKVSNKHHLMQYLNTVLLQYLYKNLAMVLARNPRATLPQRRLMEFKLNLKILGVATKLNKINKDDLQLWRRRSSSAQPCEKRGLVLQPSR